jgi:hypothetical protein
MATIRRASALASALLCKPDMRTIACIALLSLCCARSMGAAEHDAAARRDEEKAQLHQALFDPSLAVYLNDCHAVPAQGIPCWQRDRNPTAEHLRLAALLRRKAADHRAASASLREAELRACGALSESERDISPFVHVEDVASVEVLEEPGIGKQPVRIAGARIVLREVPGLTVERLQRQLDCHLARNAALGYAQSDEVVDPLDVEGVTARAAGSGDRITVTLEAVRAAAAREAAARAQRLISPRPPPSDRL